MRSNTMTTNQDIKLSSEIFPEYKSGSYGTDDYHRISPFARDLVATDGTILMAEELQAFWLLDIVASYMPKVKKLHQADEEQSFFVARLSKLEDDKALFTLDDGNDQVKIKQEIPYTDCTHNVRMYLQWGSLDGVNPMWILMMPSEY
jgi:hypothetical protein